MLEGKVVKWRRSGGQGSTAAAAWKRAPRGEEGSQEPESSFGYKSFQGGRRTERTFISTHLVGAGDSGQTPAAAEAERITDPYINLDLKKKFQSSTYYLVTNLLTRPSIIRSTLAAKFM